MLRICAVSLALLAALAAASCSSQAGSSRTRAELTSHQRDSVLAGSSLPGAATVKRALLESDRASARAASMDSLAQ
jgi:hypothetical protein